MLNRIESSTNSQRFIEYFSFLRSKCRSQWPRGLRRRSAAACVLRLWVRIPPTARMFVCCECCVLSGRGPCDALITRPEESLPTVVRRCVWSRNLVNEEALAHWWLSRQKQTINYKFKPSSPTNYFFSQVSCRSKVMNGAEWKTRRGFSFFTCRMKLLREKVRYIVTFDWLNFNTVSTLTLSMILLYPLVYKIFNTLKA